MSGPLVPLAQVPDPVFAARMVGEGVAIDPVTDCLRAPCDGVVRRLHPAHHAITLETAGGLEVLIHVGLETVGLAGEGFRPRVKDGDRVRTGDALLEFDPQVLAARAKSLLTEIVVTNVERVLSFTHGSGFVRTGDVILELTVADASPATVVAAGDSVRGASVRLPNPQGLHARPAAVLANAARSFAAEIRLERGADQASAKSVVALMGMDVAAGDTVRIAARGADAAAAVAALTKLLASGLGESGVAVGPEPPHTAPPRPTATGDLDLLAGVPASPGLAIGTVQQLHRADAVPARQGDAPHEERRKLEAALGQARVQLQALEAQLRSQADPAQAAIFAAHTELLGDPDLREPAEQAIGDGRSAAFAWHAAFVAQADRLAAIKNPLLAARASDLRDVGNRVLRLITGTESGPLEFPPDTILIAEDLTPSDTASLDRSRVRGFCTTTGGASSHVAILARSLGLPAIAGIDARALAIPAGTSAILDGAQGTLRLRPQEATLHEIRERQRQHATRRAAELLAAGQPAITLDSHRVEVAGNAGTLDDVREALALGGEGIGLLRTEFLFLGRTQPPSEDEQHAVYAAMAQLLGPDRTLTIRALDVGGDKPLAYWPIPREANPFLGQRGIRFLLDHPEVLRAQLRAILRAAPAGRIGVMFPMIATLPELRRARAILEEERAALGTARIPVGIMVEVASVAVMAEAFAREVDFFSIGTNDLTQYTLAMDRGHPRLAPQCDALNPAVLSLIDTTVRAAHQQGIKAAVCGGIASDPQAVPILVGLGIDELSVSVPVIPEIKARIRGLTYAACQALARQALASGTAEEVRALSAEAKESRR